MDRKKRRHDTAEQKVAILRDRLLDGKPVSGVCDAHDVLPSSFYEWQKKQFENGAEAARSSIWASSG